MKQKEKNFILSLDLPYQTKSAWVRIAYLYVRQKPWPDWCSYLFPLINYMQLYGILLDLHFKFYGYSDDLIYLILHTFIKIMNPIEAFDITVNNPFLVCIAIILAIYLFGSGIAYGLSIRHALKRKAGEYAPARIWASIIQIHATILAFPISSASIKFICTNENIHIFQTGFMNRVAYGASFIIFLLSFVYGIYGGAVFYNILPTKEISASRDKTDVFIVSCQKVILVIMMYAAPMSNSLAWGVIIVSIVSSMFNKGYFMTVLPYYNFEFIRFVGNLISLSTLLSWSIFINYAISLSEPMVSPYYAIVIWILSAPLALRMDCNNICRLIHRMMASDHTDINPKSLVHKIEMLKHVSRTRKEKNSEAHSMDLNHFYHISILNDVELVFGGKTRIDPNDKKGSERRIILNYLERLSAISPSSFMELYLAYWQIKKMKHYARGLLVLSQMQKKEPNPNINHAIAQLYLETYAAQEIRKKVDESMDLYTYLTNLRFLENLKDQIRIQMETQKQFWKEYKTEIPNVMNLKQYEEVINLKAEVISRMWNKNKGTLYPTFWYPHFVYGTYLSFLNNNPYQAEKMMATGLNSIKKFSQANETDHLNIDNIFSQDSIIITISGEPRNLDTILSCSNSISRYGYDPGKLIGTDLRQLLNPYYSERHHSFIQRFLKTGKRRILDRTLMNWLVDQKGYLKPVWMHLRIDPSITAGLKFTAVLRPSNTQCEYLIVTNDDKVDSFSKKIGMTLGLKRNIHVSKISDQVLNICHNFNYYGRTHMAERDSEAEQEMMKHCALHFTSSQTELGVTDGSTSHRKLLETNRNHSIHTTMYTTPDDPEPKLKVKRENLKPSIDDNMANNIFETFTSTGADVKFRHYDDVSGRLPSIREYKALVKVELRVSNGSCLKIISLESPLESIETVSVENKDSSKNNSSMEFITPRQLENYEASFGGNSFDFPIPSERSFRMNEISENKDIDIDRLHSTQTYPKINMTGNVSAYTSQYLVPKDGVDLSSMTLNPRIEKEDTQPKISLEGKPSTSIKRNQDELTKDALIDRAKIVGVVEQKFINEASSVTGSGSSKRKLESSMNMAIDYPIYPGPYKAFAIFSYMVLITVVILIWILRFASTSALNTYQESGMIVYIANERLQTLIYTARWLRYLYADKVPNVTNWTAISNRWPTAGTIIVDYLHINVKLLSEYNTELNEELPYLAFGQEEFYAQNTEIVYFNDTGQTTTNVEFFDSYHAIEVLVDNFLTLLVNASQGAPYYEEYHFLFYNTLNSVFIKSVNNYESVLSSALQQKNSNINQEYVAFYVIISLMSVNLIFLACVLLYKHMHELQLWIYLLGVNSEKIKRIEDSFERYNLILEDQRLLAESKAMEDEKSHSKRHSDLRTNSKQPKGLNFTSKSLMVTFPFLFVIIILLLDSLQELVYSTSSLNKLYTYFDKIYTLSWMQLLIDCAATGSIQLTQDNDTTPVFQFNARYAMSYLQSQLDGSFENVTNSLQNIETAEDQYLWEIYTTNEACILSYQYEAASDVCTNEAQAVANQGLEGMISAFIQAFNNVLQLYDSSSRNATQVEDLALDAILGLSGLDEICRYLLSQMTGIVGNEFLNEKSTILTTKDIFNGFSVGVGIFIWLTFYFIALKRVIDGENKFKRMFKLFPKTILLEDKVLKNYLIKHSGDTLDMYRHLL